MKMCQGSISPRKVQVFCSICIRPSCSCCSFSTSGRSIQHQLQFPFANWAGVPNRCASAHECGRARLWKPGREQGKNLYFRIRILYLFLLFSNLIIFNNLIFFCFLLDKRIFWRYFWRYRHLRIIGSISAPSLPRRPCPSRWSDTRSAQGGTGSGE